MRLLLPAALALVVSAAPGRAADTPVKGKIVAADLFKNGLAVVRYEVTLGKPGGYVLDEVPSPVHGTFTVESAGPIEVVSQLREVDVPAADAAPGDLQDDLAGKAVTVHFKGDKRPPLTGTVMAFKPTPVAVPPADGDGAAAAPAGRFLVLQTGEGRTYVDPSEVGAVEAAAPGDTVRRVRPRLRLTLGATDQPKTKVTVRYLARGLAWAASYHVDITDPKTLALEQHAIVKNELGELTGAEVRLISGYPSVEFAHVRSLLSPRATWTEFFQQLANAPQRDSDAASQVVVLSNSRSPHRTVRPEAALGAIPTGEGADLHYQPIGPRTLAVGDALALTVAKGKAGYERVVEWLVPDARDESGRSDGNPRHGDDDAWDALLFKNPLPFPMTTGPATVSAGGRFNGQRTSYWANAGEETSLRVGKALRVRTRAGETEQQPKDGGRDRDVVWVGGRQFRKAAVAGELGVSNHRAEATRVLIRCQFSGDLVQADGPPKATLRAEGVYSVNRRNELAWSVPLKAGEERTLKYSYTVLVPN